MNLTKEEALALGIKIMTDINFLYDVNAEIGVKYIEKGEYQEYNKWLISFPYGLEDFGRYIYGFIDINDDSKIAKRKISIRNGSINLGYDEEKDKYFVQSKRP
ncbi:hypothetical protein [Epilithonimonas sp.]|uniref:hypothetical protein n=1 Tax=Epilithonimonas sp. TaxID=2894511 RepID=UPI00289A8DAC|nr:hypothetical protein [Epilithonimonas sp.]